MQNENIQNYRITSSGEDYLLAIYATCRTEGSARQVDIAVYMSANTPNVIRALNSLEKKGFVTITRIMNRKNIYFTEAGRALAEKLYRRRLIVTALLESFGLSENDAAAEAHLWEHGVSEETVNAMEAGLARAKERHVSESHNTARAGARISEHLSPLERPVFHAQSAATRYPLIYSSAR
jgi:Mn-dependent DtxR family transcriptional regulator